MEELRACNCPPEPYQAQYWLYRMMELAPRKVVFKGICFPKFAWGLQRSLASTHGSLRRGPLETTAETHHACGAAVLSCQAREG